MLKPLYCIVLYCGRIRSKSPAPRKVIFNIYNNMLQAAIDISIPPSLPSSLLPSLPTSYPPSLPSSLLPSLPPSLPSSLLPSLPLTLPPSLPPSYHITCNVTQRKTINKYQIQSSSSSFYILVYNCRQPHRPASCHKNSVE